MIYIIADVGIPPVNKLGIATVSWESVCHGPDMVFIEHRPTRSVSRWSDVIRKRPFVVSRWVTGASKRRRVDFVGSSATLEGAIKIAKNAA